MQRGVNERWRHMWFAYGRQRLMATSDEGKRAAGADESISQCNEKFNRDH
jgi:hypothetical protein